MAKVYLVQMPPSRYNADIGRSEPVDISSAASFGDITKPLFPRNGVSFFTQIDVQEVRKLLKDYCDDDSILLMGDPAAIALTASLAAETNRGKYSVLRWDRPRRQYMRMTFDIRGN